MTKDEALPPLPESFGWLEPTGRSPAFHFLKRDNEQRMPVYTADQMREYARSAIAAFARTLAQRMDMEAALAQKAEPVAHEPVITNEMVLVAREVVWNHGEVVPRTHTMAEALYAAMRAAPPQRRIKVEKIPPRRLPDDDA